MAISIKENGKRAKPTDTEFMLIKMDQCTRASGKMTNITAKESKHGITEPSNMKENLLKPKRQVKVDSNLMETTMKGTSLMVNLKVKESITLLIPARFTMVNSMKTTSSDMV